MTDVFDKQELLEELDGAPHAHFAFETLVDLHHLGDLDSRSEHRIQRRQRVLKHHGDFVPSIEANVIFAHRQDVGTDNNNLTRSYFRILG